MSPDPPPTGRPLAGLRVLDLCDVRGDLCGRLLADLGADVLRIEPPEGAASRRRPPFAPEAPADSGSGGLPPPSLHFAVRNSNKRSAVLDLTTDDGRERLLALATEADVLVESLPPGYLAGLGVGPDDLLAANRGLVVASLSDLGQTGPDRDLVVTDDVLFGLSGWLHLSGIPGKPPLLTPGALASDAVGVAGTLAVLVGLVQRARGGGGQHLDVSALEALAQMNTWGIANASDTVNRGSVPPMVRSGDSPMYPTVDCADGKVRLVVISPGQWRSLWEWMGSPEAFADEYWANFFNRLMNLDVVNPLYAEHWADLPMVEGCREAQRRGIVATPLLSASDVLSDGHFASRGTFARTEVVGDTFGEALEGAVVSGFLEIDGERVGHRVRAPEIGEHRAEFTGPRFEHDSPLAVVSADDGGPGLPLTGLRVADFGHGGVGVECSRVLGEYGADVVKVESHAYPDFIRIVLGGDMTASFASSSRNKRCLGLDLKHRDAEAVLEPLLDWADVVVENNSTGTMDRLGIGWADLRERDPSQVMVSSQLMGSRGLQADWSGYGPTIQTAGGLSWLWAFDDGEGPPGSNAIHPDHLAGRICAIRPGRRTTPSPGYPAVVHRPATQTRSEPSHSARRGDRLGRGSRAFVEALKGGAPDPDRNRRRSGVSGEGPDTGGIRRRPAGHSGLGRAAGTGRANPASPTRLVCDSSAHPAENPVVGSRNPAPPTHLGDHLRGHPGASHQGGHGSPGPRGRGLRETLFVLSRCHRQRRIGPPAIRRRSTRHLPPHRGPRHVGRERV